jgi:hypothetical protein
VTLSLYGFSGLHKKTLAIPGSSVQLCVSVSGLIKLAFDIRFDCRATYCTCLAGWQCSEYVHNCRLSPRALGPVRIPHTSHSLRDLGKTF